jgi:thiol-disulfide isomerase/thioredoxin
MFLAFLFAILPSIGSRVVRATTKTFHKAVSKKSQTLVLFSSTKCAACKRLSTTMDSLSRRFLNMVGMVTVDVDNNPDLVKTYDVSLAPTIALFRPGKPRLRYYGEWTEPALIDFCESVSHDEIVVLNDSFSLVEFRYRPPANQPDGLLHKFGGIVHVGIVENPQLKAALNLSSAIYTRLGDFYTSNLTSVDEDTIEHLLQSRFHHIHSGEYFGVGPASETIAALIDERDSLMVYDVITRFRAIRDVFGNNVNFQLCNFFKCANIVDQLKLVSFMCPLYVRHSKQGGRYKIEPYPRMNPTVDDIVNWAKFQIMGIALPQEPHTTNIPRVLAPDFISLVLDSTKDIILFVASPRMPQYEESAEIFKQLMSVLEDVPEVKFYKFNPITEHVKGLKMPKSDKPQLSIWPATSEPRGSAFHACLDINVVFENLVKLVETEFSEAKLAELAERLGQLSSRA